jgi:hypothetical protein
MKRISNSDEIKINIDEQWELEWWPWRLGISRKELISAVKSVGPDLNQVKKYISWKIRRQAA